MNPTTLLLAGLAVVVGLVTWFLLFPAHAGICTTTCTQTGPTQQCTTVCL